MCSISTSSEEIVICWVFYYVLTGLLEYNETFTFGVNIKGLKTDTVGSGVAVNQ